MTDVVERLRGHIGEDHVRLCQGREYLCTCGYDENTGRILADAAEEIERLRAEVEALRAITQMPLDDYVEQLRAENERLRAVVLRAKDALLDGQSTQWVHDLLADALHREPRP